MTLNARSGASGSTFTLALAGIAIRTLRAFATALKNRVQVQGLHELDDRALKDIGLVRSDVVAALDQPLHRDPSRHLVDLAGGGRGRHKPSAVMPEGASRLRRVDADVMPGDVARA